MRPGDEPATPERATLVPSIAPAPTLPVNEVVRRAQQGDVAAFDLLYAENVGRVYALCLRMAGDVAEAETLTQDVFVRAWERLDSFRSESAFGSWLHRLAVNVVLQEWRSRRRRGARLELMEDPETAEATPAPSGGEDVETRLDLERAIARLPRGARTALVLHDIEGYTHAEIAQACGVAPGTIKAQLHRARKLLKDCLQP